MTRPLIALFAALLLALPAAAQADAGSRRFASGDFSGLAFRALGPSLTEGRISDLAVDPRDPSHYYLAAASGGVWETHNAGTTWKPIFDDQGSYSIGCLALDPSDPDIVWVGTGENNSQRSVSYGDGIYKSVDGGRHWKKVGLEASEHIAKILVDPRDGKRVWAASQGPLWRSGGDRGVFLTEDGGRTWSLSLDLGEHTGATDLIMDPRDPDVLWAAAYQRRRHVWTLINGGPGCGLWKTTDGGKTWKKSQRGLPGVDLGRIGLAQAPSRPDTLYAVVEASVGKSGFFRSTDAGENWERMSGATTSSPQYYQEIVVDPEDAHRVYLLDTWLRVSEDGGKSFARVGEQAKHVDNHALWIDPEDPRHLRAGCDGGIYESFDRGKTFGFRANLPITQFYRVTADNSEPFYFVYGGTQDNFTLGGPSRTVNTGGISNRDWFVTVGGDGFKTVVDWSDPNIVYSQWQYGGLVRHDRRTGEKLDIKPVEGADEAPYRWNWNAPLAISPHDSNRIWFGANIVFRSDDRGESWTKASGDLTRKIDRNRLPVMDRVWSIDAVSKNRSTSIWGNLVALAESPKEAGRLWAGTDDGLIHTSPDGGTTWSRMEEFPGVPDMTYVSALIPSSHDAATVYAAFDDHKRGDFRPFVLKTADNGRSWTSIAGDLPERGSVHSIAEDPVDPQLLFAGTEFGVWFTRDGGAHWVRLEKGLPTIAVREVVIQPREVDLVVGTFGRGIYVLDDYRMLRNLEPSRLEAEASLFPVRDAWIFVEASPLGYPGRAFQGDDYYMAENPPFGAVITYHLAKDLKTAQKIRRDAEAKARKKGEDVVYPSWDALRAEEREPKPAVVLTIKDAEGTVVRRLEGPAKKGLHRVAWDLRHPAPDPVRLKAPGGAAAPWAGRRQGPLLPPGRYSVSLALRRGDETVPVAGDQEFTLRLLPGRGGSPESREGAPAFHRSVLALQRAALGAGRSLSSATDRVAHLLRGLESTPGIAAGSVAEARRLHRDLLDLGIRLNGDSLRSGRNEPAPPSIRQRISRLTGHWSVTTPPTLAARRGYEVAERLFREFLPELRKAVEKRLPAMEKAAEAQGVPWTPGRIPQWPPR